MEAGTTPAGLGGRATVAREQLGVRWARWRARLPGYLVLGTLGILSLVGLKQLVVGEPAPRAAAGAAGADAAVEDFALQFARAYLTYDAERPQAREAALAAFLPRGLDADGGFTPGRGEQRVLWAQVASNQRALAGGRVVTVAAQTSSQDAPVYLAVTVRHERGRPLALVGYPSFVGAPSVDLEPAAVERGTIEEPAVVEVAARVIRNYLAGEVANLEADLSEDAVVTTPTLPLQVGSVEEVVWTGEGSDSGAVLVTVLARDGSGGSYRLSYELGIRFAERPYVDFVQVIPTDT
jgi:hypothetical protein